MSDIILKFWHVIAAFVAAAIWLLRLEARGKDNTRTIKEVEERLIRQRTEDQARAQHAEDRIFGAIQELRGEIRAALERKR